MPPTNRFAQPPTAASPAPTPPPPADLPLNPRDPAPTVQHLLDALDAAYPFAHAAIWDKVGLLVGNAQTPVTGVVTALDASLATLAFAHEKGANVIVSHHPPALAMPPHFNVTHLASSHPARVIHDAIAANIALIAVHTNLDVAQNARLLWGERLELTPLRPLPLINPQEDFAPTKPAEESDQPNATPPALGQVWRADTPRTLNELAAEVANLTGSALRAYGDGETLIATVATATGSAGGRIPEALFAGADVLIAGEFHYHDALAAVESGLCLLELGHDVSEQPLVALLSEAVHSRTTLSLDRLHQFDREPIWNGISTEIDAGGL